MSSRPIARIWNSAVIWGFGLVAMRAVGFMLVMAYALRTLETRDIGLWHVMLTLVGFGNMVEIGLNMTIGRFASYYMGGAANVPALGTQPSTTEGTHPNYAGILGLIAMARRIYAVLGILVITLTLSGWMGWCFLTRNQLDVADWSVMVAFALGSGANMAGLFWMGLLFGMNRVRLYQIIQIGGLLASYLVTATALRFEWGIASLAAGQLILRAVPRYCARRAVLSRLPQPRPVPLPVGWSDVWPITWRAGFVTAGGFMLIPAVSFVYSLSATLSETASFGLTLQLALLLRSLSDMWIFVKWPWVSAAFSRGQTRAIAVIIVRRGALALATYAAGALCLRLLGQPILALIGSHTLLATGWTQTGILVLLALDFMPGVHSALLIAMNRAPQALWYLVTGCVAASVGTAAGFAFGSEVVIWTVVLCELVWLFWRVPVEAWLVLRGKEHEARR